MLIGRYLIKEGSNKSRHHFTLTHEACHQIFKMLFPKEYASPLRLRQIHYCTIAPAENGDYWEEWCTNALASAVLMPEDMVRSNMLAFGLGEKMPMLNRVFAQESLSGPPSSYRWKSSHRDGRGWPHKSFPTYSLFQVYLFYLHGRNTPEGSIRAANTSLSLNEFLRGTGIDEADVQKVLSAYEGCSNMREVYNVLRKPIKTKIARVPSLVFCPASAAAFLFRSS